MATMAISVLHDDGEKVHSASNNVCRPPLPPLSTGGRGHYAPPPTTTTTATTTNGGTGLERDGRVSGWAKESMGESEDIHHGDSHAASYGTTMGQLWDNYGTTYGTTLKPYISLGFTCGALEKEEIIMKFLSSEGHCV